VGGGLAGQVALSAAAAGALRVMLLDMAAVLRHKSVHTSSGVSAFASGLAVAGRDDPEYL